MPDSLCPRGRNEERASNRAIISGERERDWERERVVEEVLPVPLRARDVTGVRNLDYSSNIQL
jgi:hypothetical protein